MKKKIFVALLSIVLLIGAGFAGTYAYKDYQANKDPAQTEKWQKMVYTAGEVQGLDQTDFENIFFSVENNKFYKIENGTLSEYPSESRPVGLELFGKNIAFNLNLINVDGAFFGFAKYEDSEMHYFIKATNVPVSSTYDQGSNCLLLFDNAKTGSQKDRLYEESFVFDLNRNLVRGRYIADRYRTVAADGTKRDDYAMLTTEMLQKAAPNRVLFLTRSFYAPTDDPYRVTDINTIATGYTAASTLTDVILDYAYDTDGGIFYFKRGEKEFYSMIGTGTPEDKVQCTFKGDYIKDYLRQGDHLVHIAEIENGKVIVTNAVNGDSKEYALDRGFSKVHFATMNGSKTRLLLTGEFQHTNKTGTYTLQNIALINLENGEVEQYLGTDMFNSTTRPYFVENQPVVQFAQSVLLPKFK